MKAISLCFAAAVITATIISCNPDDSVSNGTSRLQVRLTDDPAAYDEVNIDVREIRINFDGDTVNGWKTLPGVKAGVYNLLDLVNDKDTLLADAMIPSGKIHQIRLVLGDNNTIRIGEDVYELKTPSAQQSGLKLNIQQDVVNGVSYVLLMDFDAGRSVTTTGNGGYILKPVIRTAMNAIGGSIRGVVVPDSIRTNIYAIQGTDTVAGTSSDLTGGFLIKSLEAGTYDLALVPTDTAVARKTISGINVQVGQVTTVDTVHIK